MIAANPCLNPGRTMNCRVRVEPLSGHKSSKHVQDREPICNFSTARYLTAFITSISDVCSGTAPLTMTRRGLEPFSASACVECSPSLVNALGRVNYNGPCPLRAFRFFSQFSPWRCSAWPNRLSLRLRPVLCLIGARLSKCTLTKPGA
jgi:hypothetical protein